MITVFKEDGKPFGDNISKRDISIIILEAKESFDPAEAVCGGCGVKGLLAFYCSYERWLDVLEDGVPGSKKLLLDRYKCRCGKTHVVAPAEAVIPYARHSPGFIIAVIDAYVRREKPVRQIAEEFHIVVSTLYTWAKKFRNHYELFVGMLEAASGDTGEHLESVRQAPPRLLFVFVETYGACFLQTMPATGASRYFTLRGVLLFSAGASP